MALNNLGLGFVFTARNLASGTIGRLNRQVGTLGGSARRSGLMMRTGFGIATASIIPLVAGIGLLSGAMNLAQAAAQFEQGIARVGNISGASAEELRLLRNAAIDAGIATSFSPDEAVEGLAALAAQGFNAAESMGLLNQALALAEGGQIGVEDAARSTAAAIRVFNLEGDEAAQVADRLLAITNRTALQAGDLTLALGTVARGAGLTSQSLNEMLISMGLVRNTGVQVSVAAQGVSSALQFVSRNAGAFGELGVEVTNADGSFRNFLDIVAETSVELSGITDQAERSARATELFGRFGVGAFNALSNQLIQTTGVVNPSIEQMREAVTGLRSGMEDTEGTAVAFRDALLDTFAGQGRLLQGTLQTLGVVLGEPFARVFKPMIKLLVESLNTILRFFNDLPEPIKTLIAGVVVASGVFLTFSGILGIIVGLGLVAAPFFLAFIKIMGLLLLALAPVIVATAAFAAVIAGMVFVVRQNIGGLGDFFEGSFGRIRLAFRALVQLFTTGELSGEVREELQAVENQGLRRFVINLFRIGARIRTFFAGVISGFRGFATSLGPQIERMIEAFRGVGRALGFVEDSTQGLADTPMDDFADAGVQVGEVFADVLGFVVDTATVVARVFTSFVRTLMDTFEFLSPVFDQLFLAFSTLGEEIAGLFMDLGLLTDEGGTGWETFGQVVGVVVGFIGGILAGLITIIAAVAIAFVAAARFLISAWESVGTFFFELGIGIEGTMDTIRTSILNSIDQVVAFIGRTVARLPAVFGTDAAEFSGIVAAGRAAEFRISESEGDLDVRARARERQIAERSPDESAAAAATRAAGARRDDTASAIVAELARGRGEEQRRTKELAERPIVVQIDGEAVAVASVNADRRAGALGFSPVPAAVE